MEDKVYFKVVFFGTALAGKTTILEWIFKNVVPDKLKLVGDMMRLKTSFGQTLLFDFAPIKVSEQAVALFYTCTGQDYYQGTRAQLVDGSDVIFPVVDLQKKELEHNIEMIDELRHYLGTMKSLADIDVIVLFNKSDLDDVYTPERLTERLELNEWPALLTSAVTGEGLREALVLMLTRLASKLEKQGLRVL
jgi:signal recognition particle receptor subunit beta